MSAGYELMKRWAEFRGFKTAKEAADALGTIEQTVSNWKHGRSQPEERFVIKMTEDLGEDSTIALLIIAAERKKERDPNRLALMRLAKKLSAFIPLLLLSLPQPVKAEGVQVHNYNNPQFYITSTVLYIHAKRRMRTVLARILMFILSTTQSAYREDQANGLPLPA